MGISHSSLGFRSKQPFNLYNKMNANDNIEDESKSKLIKSDIEENVVADSLFFQTQENDVTMEKMNAEIEIELPLSSDIQTENCSTLEFRNEIQNEIQNENLDDIVTVSKNNKKCIEILKEHSKEIGMQVYAIANGATYSFVLAAGAKTILLIKDNEVTRGFLIAVGLLGCITRTTTIYNISKNFDFKPKDTTGKIFMGLSFLAASSFFTSGVIGAKVLSINDPYAAGFIGVAEYLFRLVTMLDASVKFPAKCREIFHSSRQAFIEKNYKEMAIIFALVFTVLGFSLGHTDAMYAMPLIIVIWFGGSDNPFLTAFNYICSAFGAIGISPILSVQGHPGLQLITGGKRENPDLKNRHIALGALMSLSSILGSFGVAGLFTAEASGAHVFGLLGLFADIVRSSSGLLYIIFLGTPGNANLICSLEKQAKPMASTCYEYTSNCKSWVVTQVTKISEHAQNKFSQSFSRDKVIYETVPNSI